MIECVHRSSRNVKCWQGHRRSLNVPNIRSSCFELFEGRFEDAR